MSAQLFEKRVTAPWIRPGHPDLIGGEPAHRIEPTAFRILAVCTGNVARSPVMERLLQAELDATMPGRFQVASAGTRALVGRAMTDESREIVIRHGGNPHSFRSRQLADGILRGVDLVVTASHEHTLAVLECSPGLLLKTFSLRELARTANAGFDDVRKSRFGEHPRDFVRRASVLRQTLRRGSLNDDDLQDPFGRGAGAYDAMSRQLVPSVRQIAAALSTVGAAS